MKKEELQSVYNTLSQFRREYYSSDTKTQSRIEDSVRSYANTLSGDLYVKLNQESANGLFRSSFFKGDLDRSLHILEEEMSK